jgi:predicted dehydrogenase|tara:strand:- start:2087 stop:3043 length:957 start_codon:yes stop_codon:yes gene_type:complete
MINWGIIGFGNMGKQYANCFRKKSSTFNLIGIASKSKKDSIKDFEFFDNYNDLIRSELIDAIYISTLNNSHKDLVCQVEKHNKKILCEKPLGMNLKEVKEMYDLLKEKKDSFLEAIAYRSHPQTEALLNLLKHQEFGEIKKIESSFGFKVKKIKKDSRLFSEKLGGGAILDVGCYPLSFFNLFTNNKKMEVMNSKFNLCETNVDIDGEITLKINDKIEAKGKVSLKENLDNLCKIYCDKAEITLQEPWLPSNKSFIEVETKSRYYKKIISSNKSAYDHQLEASSNFFSKDKKKSKILVNIEESLELSKIIGIWKNDQN